MTPTEIHRHRRVYLHCAAAVCAIAVALRLVAAAQVQDPAQRKSIDGLDKSGVKVARDEKEGQSCLGAAAKGRARREACLTGDAKGKIGKAQAGTLAAEGKMRERAGLGKTSAAAVNAGGGQRAGRTSSRTSSGRT